MLTVTFMMVSGRMIRLMDMVFTTIQMEQNMKVNGMKTSNMERASKYGRTTLVMKDNIKKVRNMAMVTSFGLTAQLTMVNSLTTIFTGLVLTNGQMVVSTRVIGQLTRCMERVFSLGTTVVGMRASTLTTRRRDMVFLHGQMVVSMMDSGRTGSSTVKAHIFQAREKLREVSGRRASGLPGLMETIEREVKTDFVVEFL